MKPKIILIVVGIVALILGFIFSIKTGSRRIVRPTPTPTPRTASSPPQITIIPGAPTTISFSSTKLPATENVLPVFSYSRKTFSVGEVASIAKRIGFSDIPLKISTKNTVMYKWTNKNASLIFIEQNGERSWILNQSDNIVFSHNPVTSAVEAKSAIETLFPPSPNSCSLVLKKESTGPFDGITSSENLKAFYFSCQTPNNQIIVNSSFGDVASSLLVNQAGVIRSLTFSFVVNVDFLYERPVLSPEESVYNIQHGKGVLVSVKREGAVSFFDEIPSFQDILFSSFSFIYYPNRKTLFLEPYYVFTGTTKAGEENLIVKYAVPALMKED